MNEVVESIYTYLLVHTLSGEKTADAVYRYFVYDESPGILSDLYGIPKGKLRGYILRVYQKAGSRNLAKSIMKKIYPLLKNIQPIIVDGYCLICGNKLVEDPMMHIRYRHGDLIDKLTPFKKGKRNEVANG